MPLVAENIIVLLYGSQVLWFYESGRLAFFVNPIYNGLIVASGAILTVIALYLMVARQKGNPGRLSVGGAASVFMLILPLALGITLRPQSLSSQSALLRGVTQNLSGQAGIAPSSFAKPAEERTIIEWVRALNADPEPDNHVGDKVKVEGMTIVDPALPRGYFYIGRFLVTCCVADAQTIVLPVHYDPATFQPKNNQWMDLKGVMAGATLSGQRTVAVELGDFKWIDQPENPYDH